MYNATNLLGTLMQHIATPSARGRVGEALTREAGSSGPLGGLLSRLGGDRLGGGILGNLIGALGGGGRGAEGHGQNLMDLARQAIASPGQELASNNPVAVGGLGALVGKLVGGGRGAIGGGLLAVLGSLAYSALQAQGARGLASLGDQPSAMPAAAVSGGYGRPGVAALPTTELDMERMARLVLRSMIQAAKADNQIDASEIERITGKISEADGTEAAEARSFVLQELRGPADIDGLVREVRSPLEAAEVYAAALMAINVDSDAERDYLARLALALALTPDTVAHLHQSLGLPTAA